MKRLLVCLMLGPAVLAATAMAAPRDTLTVVSLNLWHDQHDWPSRLRRIVRELRAIKPDVVCLQEVLQHEQLPNQAHALGDSLGMQVHFTSVDPEDSPKRYGNAVLSRHRVLATGGRALLPLDDYRTVAHVRLDLGGREIDVYDTHLHHTPEGGAIRTTQIRDLLAFVDSTRGRGGLVLAGDFNCRPSTAELQLLSPQYVNVFLALHPHATAAEAATFNPHFSPGPGHIDHIFVPRRGRVRLTPVASEVLFRDPGPDSVWASDHFGVLARLRVSGR